MTHFVPQIFGFNITSFLKCLKWQVACCHCFHFRVCICFCPSHDTGNYYPVSYDWCHVTFDKSSPSFTWLYHDSNQVYIFVIFSKNFTSGWVMFRLHSIVVSGTLSIERLTFWTCDTGAYLQMLLISNLDILT